MNDRGSVTVEMVMIMSIFLVLIMGVIGISINIHNHVIKNSDKIYCSVRQNEIDNLENIRKRQVIKDGIK